MAIPIPLNARQTDVPTTPPMAAESSSAASQDPGVVTWAQAAGTGVGSMMKAAGPSGPLLGPALGFFVAAMIGVVLWMNARVSQAEDAYKAAGDKLGAYDARLIKIEMTLEEYAAAAKELPEIRKSLDRLVEDQRRAAGGIETLERLIKEDKNP